MSPATMARRYPMFIIIFCVGALYYITNPFADFELFDRFIKLLVKFEDLKLHEIIFLTLFLVVGVAVDQTRNGARDRRQRKLARERLRTVQTTMATVQDIVNNALNNLVFIQIEAEKSQALSPETLETFDKLITGTAEKLRDVNELEVVSERDLGEDIRSLKLDNRGA